MLVFSHIPKTAGTSLKYLMRRHFGPSQLDAIYRKGARSHAYRETDLRRDILIYPNIKLLAGHCIKPFVSFGDYEREMRWFTFLRDPIQRFISHYVHEQTQTGNPHHKGSLEEWSKNLHRSNWMLKMFTEDGRNLDRAKEMLRSRFEFVGKVDEFDLSMKLFKHKFELHDFCTTLESPRMVIRDKSIREDILGNYHKYEDIILSNNDRDIELYDYFLKEIWPLQLEWVTEESFNQTIIPDNTNHAFNLFAGKLKRNLIYKPYVKYLKR